MNLRKKIKFHWAFYLSTLRLSLITVLTAAAICAIRGMGVKDCIAVILFLYPTLGLGVDFIHKRLLRKNEFYFYHNASCSTMELLSVSFVLSVTISTTIHQITKSWI